MTASSTPDVLTEVWAIKDSLSAQHGHDLKTTCRALYAEQARHPADFVHLGAEPKPEKILKMPSLPARTPASVSSK